VVILELVAERMHIGQLGALLIGGWESMSQISDNYSQSSPRSTQIVHRAIVC